MKVLIIILCLIYALFLTHMFTRLLTTKRAFYISRIRKRLLCRHYHIKEGEIEKL